MIEMSIESLPSQKSICINPRTERDIQIVHVVIEWYVRKVQIE